MRCKRCLKNVIHYFCFCIEEGMQLCPHVKLVCCVPCSRVERAQIGKCVFSWNLMCYFWSLSTAGGFQLTDVNKIWKTNGTKGLLKLTKFGAASLIFENIRPQQYLEKQRKYGNLLRLLRLLGDMGGVNSQTHSVCLQYWATLLCEETPGRWCTGF